MARDSVQFLLHHGMLGHRLYMYCLARFLVVSCIIAGSYLARHVVRIEGLDIRGLMAVAGGLFVYNSVAYFTLRRYRRGRTTARRRPYLIGIMNGTIILDFIFLTVTLWLVGGTQSPFKAFYVVNVVLAAVLLPRPMAYGHAILAYLMFTLLVMGEWMGWIPPRLPLGAVASSGMPDPRYFFTVLLVQFLLIGVTVFVLTSLTQVLRRGERQRLEALDEVTRYSEIQRNFLHITIHDLKSPVAGAQSQLHILREEIEGPLTPSQHDRVDHIQRRLEGLTHLLRDFEVLASLESVNLKDQGEAVELKPILENLVEENQDLAREHEHEMTLDEIDGLGPVHGIELLLRESVANFVTNAIKYTPDGGRIRVGAIERNGWVRVEVQDSGVGIAPEDQGRLFQEFVRLRRRGVPMANREGSGLGLSIVQRVAEMHGGRVGVESRVDEGSTFYIELPAVGAKIPSPDQSDDSA